MEKQTPDSITHEQLHHGAAAEEIRKQEIDQLEALYALPEVAEPDYPEEVVIDESISIDQKIKEPSEETYTRRKKIAARLAPIALYSNAVNAAQRLSTHFAERRQKTNEKYAVNEDDSRFARARKFLGRNATRIALGTMVTLGAGIVLGARMKGAEMSIQAPDAHTTLTENMNITKLSDHQYLIGGHFDKKGNMIASDVRDMANLNNGGNTTKVPYAAEIAPFPGESHTLDQSTKMASDNVFNSWKQNPGKPVEIVGFSQGTQGAIDAAKRIEAAGGTAKLVLIAPPNGETGFFNTPYAEAASPILKQMGITTDVKLPKGTTVVAYDSDFWANSNKKSLTTQVSQLIGLAGDSHTAPTDSRAVPVSTTTIDGITYQTYTHKSGPQTAALRTLQQATGIKVTKGMDELGQAIAPQGEVGKATTVDANKVITASKNLVAEGLRDRGVAGANTIANQVVDAVPKPLVQGVTDILNIPAGGGSGNTVVDTTPAPSWTPPAVETPTVAPTPVTQPIEQAQQVVNNAAQTVQSVAPKEAAPVINEVQKNVNNFLGNLPKIG